MKKDKCPDALWHDLNEATGKCHWCGRQLRQPYNPKPTLDHTVKNNQDLAYEYYLDPDFGLNYQDKYLGDA